MRTGPRSTSPSLKRYGLTLAAVSAASMLVVGADHRRSLSVGGLRLRRTPSPSASTAPYASKSAPSRETSTSATLASAPVAAGRFQDLSLRPTKDGPDGARLEPSGSPAAALERWLSPLVTAATTVPSMSAVKTSVSYSGSEQHELVNATSAVALRFSL